MTFFITFIARRQTRATLLIFVSTLLALSAQAQWSQSGGLGYGDFDKFVFDENNVYALTSSLGAFRSSNQGINWQPITVGAPGNKVYELCACHLTIFASVLPKNGSPGIYISEDSGTTW